MSTEVEQVFNDLTCHIEELLKLSSESRTTSECQLYLIRGRVEALRQIKNYTAELKKKYNKEA